MAYIFFRTLGFNVLLSPETDEHIIRLSQELTEEETCFPVKLIVLKPMSPDRKAKEKLTLPFPPVFSQVALKNYIKTARYFCRTSSLIVA